MVGVPRFFWPLGALCVDRLTPAEKSLVLDQVPIVYNGHGRIGNGVELFSLSSQLQRRLSAPCLAVVIAATMLRETAGVTVATYAAVPALLLYLALEWGRLRLNAKILVVLSLGLSAWSVRSLGSGEAVWTGFARGCYFPTFLAVLGFLREAAATSPLVRRCGHYLVNQPTSRRYVALTLGGHLFGILLNIGGLALLVSMLRQSNTLESAGGVAHVQELRERRMVTAVLRGFCSMALWSPLSIMLALLTASMPALRWSDFAPYGMGLSVAFLVLGWLFDRLFMPRRASAAHDEDTGHIGLVAAVAAQVIAITFLAYCIEEALGQRFLNAVLLVVPVYALVWAALQNKALGLAGSIQEGARQIARRSWDAFPTYGNEVAIFSASGVLGVVLIALMPHSVAHDLFAYVQESPNALVVLMAWLVFVLGVLGLNPMISVSILAGTAAEMAIPDLSFAKIALGLIGGWVATVSVGPLVASMIILGNILDRSPAQIGLKWNGAFGLTFMALFSLFLLLTPF